MNAYKCYKNMKRTIYILIAAVALISCVKDLDTLPLNRTEPVAEYVYGNSEEAYLSGLARLYFQFVTNDLTDMQPMDGGASELIRAFWSVQETTTDEAKCSWENDAWVRALNTNTWTDVQNDAVYAVYVRTLQGIALVNEYLRQTSPERLSDRGVSSVLASKIEGFRAEARFIRAYLYWIALDCFGNVPFTTENSPFGGTYFPEQASRERVFNYCVGELQALLSEDSAMPQPRSLYPRADKGSVAGLLARMYGFFSSQLLFQGCQLCDEVACREQFFDAFFQRDDLFKGCQVTCGNERLGLCGQFCDFILFCQISTFAISCCFERFGKLFIQQFGIFRRNRTGILICLGKTVYFRLIINVTGLGEFFQLRTNTFLLMQELLQTFGDFAHFLLHKIVKRSIHDAYYSTYR